MKTGMNILVIEDNPGDYLLVEVFLTQKIEGVRLVHASSFKDAKGILSAENADFDSILLDLSLPDCSGEPLIQETLDICGKSPVIVLTGYTNFAFGVRTMSMGISDYILKEELTAEVLYKSIIYSAERKKGITELEESEKKYFDLFHSSPVPMWVVDVETLRFLDINQATVKNYGFTRDEFLSMTLKDILLSHEDALLDEQVAKLFEHSKDTVQFMVAHKNKNGETRNVEVQITPLEYKGVKANFVIATDLTEKIRYTTAIEEQNTKLKAIAWEQSHMVRAPLARIMGLVNLIREMEAEPAETKRILDYLMQTAHELDGVIRRINDNAGEVVW
jgi:PAS domain S-box-containing protein